MPHIKLPEGLPGILGPMAFRPESAKPLNELAEILLRGPSTLSPGERELIATFVSSQTTVSSVNPFTVQLPRTSSEARKSWF